MRYDPMTRFSLVRRRLVVLLAVVLLTVPGHAPVRAAESYTAQERRFVQLINTARGARGLPELASSPEAAAVARRWSRRMATDGRLRHNPRVGGQLPMRWRRWAENVGWNSGGGRSLSAVTASLHRRFMASDGHRANILGRYNQVGVGVAVARDGALWATMVFVQAPLSGGARPGLRDTVGSVHRRAIRTATNRGLIAPCDAARRRFCPDRRATRATVAAALARMRDLPPGRTRHFTDVRPPSYADALAAAGVVKGCARRRFCPGGAVTRGQLASLFVRALPGLAPRSGGPFRDLSSVPVHARAANGLARAGVARGCGPRRFCPHRTVTRAQLATFVVRALDAARTR